MNAMRKFSKSLICGSFLALICLRPMHAQTAANPPTAANATVANPAPTVQAPDDMMKKLSDLVHAGKYSEAQQTVAALLILYPGDQRLTKAKTLLDKALLSSKSTETTERWNPPTASVAPPATVDKVEYNSLIELVGNAQQTTDLEQQKALLQRFMNMSSPFLLKHPNEMLLWLLRAESALSLDDLRAGYEAGQRLLAAGAASSSDANLQRLLAQLNLKGWLDHKNVKLIEQEERFEWLLGTWNVYWMWSRYGGINSRDQELFVVSESGVEGYVIGDDGTKSAEPDFRGTILDSGEIKWECYLPPTDIGGLYAFRHLAGGKSGRTTIGRKSDLHGYFANGEDTGKQPFYPFGWQPVISYEFDKNKKTMKMVIPPQEADPQNTYSKKNPIFLSFGKVESRQAGQVK